MKKNGLINLVKKTTEKETRKLQSTNPGIYEFIIENKYEKKYKYTDDVKNKLLVISEGNKEEEENEDEIPKPINKSNYFKLNMLFPLFLILFL